MDNGSLNDAPLQPETVEDEIVQRIHLQGMEALDLGLLKGFPGFETGPLLDKFTVAMHFYSLEITRVLQPLLIQPIVKYARRPDTKIPLVVAEDNHKLHCTVMEGRYTCKKNLSLEDRNKDRKDVFAKVRNDRMMTVIQESLRKLWIRDWRMVVDKTGNVLIVTPKVDKEVAYARSELKILYASCGLHPIENDIEHCTITKPFIRQGTDIAPKVVRRFGRHLRKVKQGFDGKLSLHVLDAFVGPSVDLMMHTNQAPS